MGDVILELLEFIKKEHQQIRENYIEVTKEAIAEMKQVEAFLHAFLVEAKTPHQIARLSPAQGSAWKLLVGTEDETLYGRPVAFHQQAQQQDWTAAWGRVNAPVLVLFGEYDWYEEAGGHELIARIVIRRHPAHTEFRVIPRTDHHFERFDRLEDAVRGTGGTIDEGPAVEAILAWLRDLFGR